MSKRRISVLKGGIFAVIAVLLILPVMAVAGSLEPSAAPAPTMKTLDQIPPAWSQKLPASERFVIVLNNAAVLDKETGLVWEKSPILADHIWVNAISHCTTRYIGGRKGWHLPTVEQLASLVDPTQSYPSLPSGHPFTNLQMAYYWSSTTAADNTGYAWSVDFGYAGVNSGNKNYGGYVWCVRGGQSHDAY